MVAIKKILLPSTTPYEIAPHEVFNAQWAEQYHRNTFIGQLGLVKRERIEKISFLEAETLYYKACLIQFRSIAQLRRYVKPRLPLRRRENKRRVSAVTLEKNLSLLVTISFFAIRPLLIFTLWSSGSFWLDCLSIQPSICCICSSIHLRGK